MLTTRGLPSYSDREIDGAMGDGLKFGTSGIRGLASELQGDAARRYTAAFLTHLGKRKVAGYSRLFIARDLRESSPAIAADVASAARAAGLMPVDCGVLPTPALALYAMEEGGPAVMVTGSHIPADRNGLKFYTQQGEITKEDELGILGALVDAAPDVAGDFEDRYPQAGDRYRRRYLGLLPFGTLSGWRIGVFEHSSAARDILASLLYRAGAEVVRLGRTDTFVPVDTEAVNDPVFDEPRGWITRHRLDALVSTDGDGDRPLIIDKDGRFVRGDVIGLVTAGYLWADTVVTGVTSNSGIEALGAFRKVERTKVGSPHVIAGMEAAAHDGGTIVGFEANGGTLLGTDVEIEGKRLARLPTRDAILPILCVLATAARDKKPIAEIVAGLPLRPATSDRLTEVPMEKSAAFVARLGTEPAYARDFFSGIGEVESVSAIDGPRFTLKSGDIVHYRASGNAPELRCYVEARSVERAEMLLRWGLDAAGKVVRSS
jgi:phosphomannomutase